MFRLIKIKGGSMQPDYCHNDYVLLAQWCKNALSVGDDVVCRHADAGLILKRIKNISSDGLQLTGLNARSAEPASLGNIQRRDVVGRVVWHIKPLR